MNHPNGIFDNRKTQTRQMWHYGLLLSDSPKESVDEFLRKYKSRLVKKWGYYPDLKEAR
jgi:hypothetical protein